MECPSAYEDRLCRIEGGRRPDDCPTVTHAAIMNRAGTELNVVLGLCVGHDSLVFRHSDAPCTVLAAKDRVLGHNPLAAVYTMQGHYKHLARRS